MSKGISINKQELEVIKELLTDAIFNPFNHPCCRVLSVNDYGRVIVFYTVTDADCKNLDKSGQKPDFLKPGDRISGIYSFTGSFEELCYKNEALIVNNNCFIE